MTIQTPIDPYETDMKKTYRSATTAASTIVTTRLESFENNFVRNIDSYAE